MDDLPKIECTTVVTWRNTKTGEVFKEKKEGPDIAQDVTVQVSPKGLDILQKVMKKHNERKP
jgi:hypothetical protein|tara:strand:+ start:287 stop:472 length:186 start_codon:yes stop_codon:yes gene_type:complete